GAEIEVFNLYANCHCVSRLGVVLFLSPLPSRERIRGGAGVSGSMLPACGTMSACKPTCALQVRGCLIKKPKWACPLLKPPHLQCAVDFRGAYLLPEPPHPCPLPQGERELPAFLHTCLGIYPPVTGGKNATSP